MPRLQWKVLQVGPCDPVALDGIENLSDAELAALVGEIPADPSSGRATAPGSTRARVGSTPDRRHHTPMPSIPPLHFSACP